MHFSTWLDAEDGQWVHLLAVRRSRVLDTLYNMRLIRLSQFVPSAADQVLDQQMVALFLLHELPAANFQPIVLDLCYELLEYLTSADLCFFSAELPNLLVQVDQLLEQIVVVVFETGKLRELRLNQRL